MYLANLLCLLSILCHIIYRLSSCYHNPFFVSNYSILTAVLICICVFRNILITGAIITAAGVAIGALDLTMAAS